MTFSAARISTLVAADGVPLHVRDWTGGGEGVLIMHGLGEHSGRYERLACWFNDLGYAVRAYDHRGHGRSAGARGDVPHARALVDDAKRVLDDYARALARPPLLLGHSMGGLFAAHLAAQRLSPLSGLILSSPALSVALTHPQRVLLRLLAALAPGLGVANGLDARYLSHREDIVRAYREDPLVHRKISARLLGSMLLAADFAHAQAAALRVPTLLLVAGEDHLVDARGSSAFFERLAPGLGTLHYYPGYYHELFNEIEAGPVFADLKAWLARGRQTGVR